MKNLEFNQSHYEKMVEINEDYQKLSFDELKEDVQKGAEIVEKNKGFSRLDEKLDEDGMINVSAFIYFRLAKKDLGEFVEEIDN